MGRGGAGRGARPATRPPDGRRAGARRPPRGRARDHRPRVVSQDPRLPRRQGADAGARAARRQGAHLRRGGRQPHLRLVLERRRPRAHPARRAAGVRVRAADRGGRLALHRDRARAAEGRGRRLDGARGRAARRRGPGGARRAASSRRSATRSPSSSRSRGGPHAKATRSSSTSSRRAARRTATRRRARRGPLVDEIEAALLGASAGETRDRRRTSWRTSRPRRVEVTVKEIKEKVLPGRRRRARALRERVRHDRRAARRHRGAPATRRSRPRSRTRFARAPSTRSSAPRTSAPAGPLVESRTRELLTGFVRSLERRGIALETYLQLTGPARRGADGVAAARGVAVGRARARPRGGRRQARAPGLRRRGEGARARAGRSRGRGCRAA